MNSEIPNKYLIEYSNHFEFNGCLLAFRKQELFNITDVPNHIPFNKIANCWIVNRKQLSKKKAQELVKKEHIIKDLSELQWYQQEQLKHVFNLWN